MTYTICIPSYKRYTIINGLTLKCLEDNNINPNRVKIFVVKEEYDLYRSAVNPKYEIVVGKLGIINQRRFIEQYFTAGKHIVYMDDDIKEIDLKLHPEATDLDDFIKQAFKECIENDAYIWSVYPVFNNFYRKQNKRMTTYLSMMVGVFYGIINRPNLGALRNTINNSNKEDIERSLLYFINDGKVIRYNRVGFNTKYYGSIGGIGNLKERLPDIVKNTKQLLEKYPKYGTIKVRNNGIWEFVLKRLKEP